MSARVLVVANDHVGSKMAGPGIRSLRFATELARDHDVTLAVPFATDISDERITIVQDDPWDARRMNQRVRRFDVVIAQKLPVSTMRLLAKSEVVAIYDLYAPLAVESLAWASRRPRTVRDDVTQRLNSLTQEITLSYGDAFICASEIQRDFWLGALFSVGRIGPDQYSDEPSLRGLIDVVPFGIEAEPPRHTRHAVKGVVPGIAESDRLLLWGGGIWNWFDPLTVIRSIAAVSRQRDDVRLFFMGLGHPNPAVPEMEMERRAIVLAGELGLTDRVVFFNKGWVPYEERGAYFLEADLGVSAHFDDLETRLAFRTRLLDCIWATLPIVTTGGDALGEMVDHRGLGRAVAAEDVDGWVSALGRLLDDDDERNAIREQSIAVRSEFVWPRVVAPLRRLVASTRAQPGSARARTLVRYAFDRVHNALLQRGPTAAGTAAMRRLTGTTPPLEKRVQPPLPPLP